jgi:hypothetical protein
MYAVGDTVRLASGGPVMTVTRVIPKSRLSQGETFMRPILTVVLGLFLIAVAGCVPSQRPEQAPPVKPDNYAQADPPKQVDPLKQPDPIVSPAEQGLRVTRCLIYRPHG